MAPDHDEQSSLNPEVEVAASLIGMMLADRYRVERVIGIGGVGTVFRATQIGLDRRVAIKVLRPELPQNPTAMERFAREARTAAALLFQPPVDGAGWPLFTSPSPSIISLHMNVPPAGRRAASGSRVAWCAPL